MPAAAPVEVWPAATSEDGVELVAAFPAAGGLLVLAAALVSGVAVPVALVAPGWAAAFWSGVVEVADVVLVVLDCEVVDWAFISGEVLPAALVLGVVPEEAPGCAVWFCALMSVEPAVVPVALDDGCVALALDWPLISGEVPVALVPAADEGCAELALDWPLISGEVPVAAVPPVVLVPAEAEGCADADWLLMSVEAPVVAAALGGLLPLVPLWLHVSAILVTSVTAKLLPPPLTPAEACPPETPADALALACCCWPLTWIIWPTWSFSIESWPVSLYVAPDWSVRVKLPSEPLRQPLSEVALALAGALLVWLLV